MPKVRQIREHMALQIADLEKQEEDHGGQSTAPGRILHERAYQLRQLLTWIDDANESTD